MSVGGGVVVAGVGVAKVLRTKVDFGVVVGNVVVVVVVVKWRGRDQFAVARAILIGTTATATAAAVGVYGQREQRLECGLHGECGQDVARLEAVVGARLVGAEAVCF